MKEYKIYQVTPLKSQHFSYIFFNKYKIKFIKRSLHHLVGNLILYNVSFYFLP